MWLWLLTHGTCKMRIHWIRRAHEHTSQYTYAICVQKKKHQQHNFKRFWSAQTVEWKFHILSLATAGTHRKSGSRVLYKLVETDDHNVNWTCITVWSVAVLLLILYLVFYLYVYLLTVFCFCFFRFTKNKPISQWCALKWKILAGHWTIKLDIQTAGRQTLVFVLTQLNFGQWSSLPLCLPNLIVQWPARIFHV